ncbi:unnamed protein product [Effrenium voratum]|nr:unnamed protein product [Effrenium voratum]
MEPEKPAKGSSPRQRDVLSRNRRPRNIKLPLAGGPGAAESTENFHLGVKVGWPDKLGRPPFTSHLPSLLCQAAGNPCPEVISGCFKVDALSLAECLGFAWLFYTMLGFPMVNSKGTGNLFYPRAADATERDVSAFRHKARVDRGNRRLIEGGLAYRQPALGEGEGVGQWDTSRKSLHGKVRVDPRQLFHERWGQRVDAVLQAWRLHVVRCNTRRCCWDEAEARAVAAARAKLLEEGLACWASAAQQSWAQRRAAQLLTEQRWQRQIQDAFAAWSQECPRQATPSQLIAHPELFFPSSESSISASSYTSSEGPSSLRPRAQQLAFLRSFRVDVRLRARAAFGAWRSAAGLRRQKAVMLDVVDGWQKTSQGLSARLLFSTWRATTRRRKQLECAARCLQHRAASNMLRFVVLQWFAACRLVGWRRMFAQHLSRRDLHSIWGFWVLACSISKAERSQLAALDRQVGYLHKAQTQAERLSEQPLHEAETAMLALVRWKAFCQQGRASRTIDELKQALLNTESHAKVMLGDAMDDWQKTSQGLSARLLFSTWRAMTRRRKQLECAARCLQHRAASNMLRFVVLQWCAACRLVGGRRMFAQHLSRRDLHSIWGFWVLACSISKAERSQLAALDRQVGYMHKAQTQAERLSEQPLHEAETAMLALVRWKAFRQQGRASRTIDELKQALLNTESHAKVMLGDAMDDWQKTSQGLSARLLFSTWRATTRRRKQLECAARCLQHRAASNMLRFVVLQWCAACRLVGGRRMFAQHLSRRDLHSIWGFWVLACSISKADRSQLAALDRQVGYMHKAQTQAERLSEQPLHEAETAMLALVRWKAFCQQGRASRTIDELKQALLNTESHAKVMLGDAMDDWQKTSQGLSARLLFSTWRAMTRQRKQLEYAARCLQHRAASNMLRFVVLQWCAACRLVGGRRMFAQHLSRRDLHSIWVFWVLACSISKAECSQSATVQWKDWHRHHQSRLALAWAAWILEAQTQRLKIQRQETVSLLLREAGALQLQVTWLLWCHFARISSRATRRFEGLMAAWHRSKGLGLLLMAFQCWALPEPAPRLQLEDPPEAQTREEAPSLAIFLAWRLLTVQSLRLQEAPQKARHLDSVSAILRGLAEGSLLRAAFVSWHEELRDAAETALCQCLEGWVERQQAAASWAVAAVQQMAFHAWRGWRRRQAWSLRICGRLQQSERLCWLARCFGSWACAELPRPSSAVLQPTALPSSPSSISRASEAGSGVRSSSAAGPPQPEEEAEEAEEAEAAECSAQPEEEQVPDLVFQPILDPKEEASGKSTAPPVADGSERLDSTSFPPVSREESILKRIYLKRTPVLRMVMNRWWEACLSKGMQDLRLPSPQRRAAEPEMRPPSPDAKSPSRPASPDKSESPLRARRRRAASLARLLEEAEAAAHEAAPAKKAPLRERQLEENLRWGDETWMLARASGRMGGIALAVEKQVQEGLACANCMAFARVTPLRGIRVRPERDPERDPERGFACLCKASLAALVLAGACALHP